MLFKIDFKILNKEEGKDSSAFSINKSFTSNNITNISNKITIFSQGKKQNIYKKRKLFMINYLHFYILLEKIDDDRSAAIEASIVRIMKQEKKCNHFSLVEKVEKQLEEYFTVKLDVII